MFLSSHLQTGNNNKLPRGLFRQLSSLFLIWSELHEEFPPLNTPKHNHQVEGNWEIKPNTFTPFAVSHQPNHNNIICINGQCSFLSHSKHTNRCLFYHSHSSPLLLLLSPLANVCCCQPILVISVLNLFESAKGTTKINSELMSDFHC